MSKGPPAFLRRWWNWWRLPRFKNDDEMAAWFESAPSSAFFLPPANGVAISPDLKVTIEALPPAASSGGTENT